MNGVRKPSIRQLLLIVRATLALLAIRTTAADNDDILQRELTECAIRRASVCHTSVPPRISPRLVL